ncbi:hypothetical protein NE301_03660 [Lactococcus lactis]|uniref:hypothetical protein n=1 Tax=Lactococcus lactis TaxID=1358 RepID=UPI0020736E7B|nr:hypothetical protein [Lactococcus lactis]MCM6841306.1 hypothetical protein [Lactococcus lactis]MCM6849937.1 hypothetical protein [Lactococcus lactis]MCM6852359.1 hypothetical protein [Lactococcus lactis]MCM6860033.1 hypothetical protein [Lactococcus lactis]
MGLFSDIWASVKSKSENTDVSGYTALFNAQATLGMKNAALESLRFPLQKNKNYQNKKW